VEEVDTAHRHQSSILGCLFTRRDTAQGLGVREPSPHFNVPTNDTVRREGIVIDGKIYENHRNKYFYLVEREQ
jgi:hypothetical protein